MNMNALDTKAQELSQKSAEEKQRTFELFWNLKPKEVEVNKETAKMIYEAGFARGETFAVIEMIMQVLENKGKE